MLEQIQIYRDHLFRVFAIFNKSNFFIARLYFCFLLMAALDLLGISLIGPFVVVIFDFTRIQQEYGLFKEVPQDQLAIFFSLIIVATFAIRTIGVWLVNAYILKVIFEKQVEVRGRIMHDLLAQEYSKRLEKSTGHYSRAMFSFTQSFVQSLINIFRIAAESTSVLFIIILLMFTNLNLFLVAFLFSSLTLGVMFYFFSQTFIKYGEIKNKGLLKFSNAVNEGVDGIKEIKILGLSKFFQDKVKEGATLSANAERRLYLYSIVPRYLIETALVCIICLILSISMRGAADPVETLSVLSIFLVACLRLLPSISMMISAFNGISLDLPAIKTLYNEFITRDLFKSPPVISESFKSSLISEIKSIEIKDLSFSYDTSGPILINANLKIDQGDFVGLVGQSGEGKTTLIDLILGIRKPIDGDILVNGYSIHSALESWRSKIAYLPQEIFIINGTVAENVALGIRKEEIDDLQVHNALNQAGLKTLIESLPDGIHTEAGDKGLKFSGGQRQRIALARAFFSERKIFLFDESTSALDQASSDQILDQIVNLASSGATVILISHNEKMLQKCNRRVRISNGELVNIS